MVNYENSRIYKLVNYDCGLVYYGSTTQPLRKRFYGHKADAKSASTSSSELFAYSDNVKIVLVEDYPCKDKYKLLAREGWYVENNRCVNKNVPNRPAKMRAMKERFWSTRVKPPSTYNHHLRSPFGMMCKSHGIFN